jgi:IS605 OrfB family transposase
MLTLKIKYNSDKQEIINSFINNYTGVFYKLYNNPELMIDEGFVQSNLNNYVDKSIYESCLVDVKTKLSQFETIVKKRNEQINEIIELLKEDNFETKKELKKKYHLMNKLAYLSKSKDKNIVFGGKGLLRRITKLSQRIANKHINNNNNNITSEIEKDKTLLDQYKSEFKAKRKIGLFVVGRACENGSRKFDFKFNDNIIIFKPNKNNKIVLDLVLSKNQKKTLNKLQILCDNKQIPLTVRLNNEYINISYDEELLTNYVFDEKSCKEEQNEHIDKEVKKQIYIKWKEEQNDRKLDNKIRDRYCSIDLNPQFIGLSIIDKLDDNGNFNIVYKEALSLEKLGRKLGFSSNSNRQLKQNNKRKHEICCTWKYIFNLCKHYKVAYFAMEDLNFKPKQDKVNSNEGNRKTKNLWHIVLTKSLIDKYCTINGIIKIEVNPAYSSFIGNMVYDYFDPISSSLEIGRRGIVKYKKGGSIYPELKRINQEKLNYLLGENVFDEGETWVSLYRTLHLKRYRNMVKPMLVDNYLFNSNSRIKRICE